MNASRILSDVDQLLRTASLRRSGVEGKLSVGVVSSISGGTARELLSAFVTTHPNVELDIIEGSPREHLAEVRSLRMDVTFVVDHPPAPGCEIEPLWAEPILVALPAGHTLAARDSIKWVQIAEERFIVSRTDPGPEIHDFVVKPTLPPGCPRS